jgi:hypothetical protein
MGVVIEGYLEILADDQWQFGGQMIPNRELDREGKFRPSAFFLSGSGFAQRNRFAQRGEPHNRQPATKLP